MLDSQSHSAKGKTMQPVKQKVANEMGNESQNMLRRLESLVKKNESAYQSAMEDFRDQFTLGPTGYDADR